MIKPSFNFKLNTDKNGKPTTISLDIVDGFKSAISIELPYDITPFLSDSHAQILKQALIKKFSKDSGEEGGNNA